MYTGDIVKCLKGENENVSHYANMMKVICKKVNVEIMKMIEIDWTPKSRFVIRRKEQTITKTENVDGEKKKI